MKERTVICENTTELTTPVGVFSVWDGQEKVTFSVYNYDGEEPWQVYENGNEIVTGLIQPEVKCYIVIDTNKLEKGKVYRVSFSSGKWEYCDGDEHSNSFWSVIGEWAIGIGAYDPNDEEKTDQIFEYSRKNGYLEKGDYRDPPFYDESRFTKYTVWPLEELNGYNLKIFDNTAKIVKFPIAWVRIREYPVYEYGEALGYWLVF